MFPNTPKYHQILPFFWFLFVFGCYLTLKSRTIEWVKKSSLQYPSEESAASSPGLFPFSKGKPWERGWGVEILDIIGTERGSSSVSRLCLIWIQLFQRCHDGQLNSLTQCEAYFYDVASLRSWRYCVGARLRFWRRSRVPKKGSRCAGYSKYRGFLAGGISTASSLLPFFGTRLRRQNFNLAPTQYRQLRRLMISIYVPGQQSK